MKSAFLGVIASLVFLFLYGCTHDPAPGATAVKPLAGRGPAVIVADIVALDEMLVYNRFGSFNPFGMIYALRDDVVPDTFDVQFANAKECEAADVEAKSRSVHAELKAGQVRLRDCKRPRPLVLRANVGDTLEVHFQNLLRDVQPDVSQTYCPEEYRNKPAGKDNLEDVLWKDEHPNGPNDPRHNCKKTTNAEAEPANMAATDWPKTRRANFAIAGLKLTADADKAEGFDRDVCLGISSLLPGQKKVVCRYEITQEGPYFASSSAAIAGGEGDGGSLTHGLFAAVLAEPEKSAWYRSQVAKGVFDAVWPNKGDAAQAPYHARSGALDYEAGFKLGDNPNYPYLNMLTPDVGEVAKNGGSDKPRLRLAHADINAIVRERRKNVEGAPIEDQFNAFREFTVVLHDELKTFYPDAYKILTGADESRFTQLAGVRDGFGINYGAGGMGPMLIANRKKIGPAADCVECLYEEFFLQSWANGDPALLERFPDDPSNVHHSYLNDRIVFRNFHAGPKETHVFHLHAHQWFAGNDTGRGAYLDSQTVGPQQGFTYRIYDGGLNHNGKGKGGWWDSHGAGNRNRSPGDSIFHCHLYPHFAQGMWELWRNHDVLEDGSRKLSDGQRDDKLSITYDERRTPRPGSVAENMAYIPAAEGTPIPAIVPLPDEPLPLLPTYGDAGMPGYPFYIAGKPGHRAPQPPLDMAKDKDNNFAPMDGGLPRHVILEGKRTFAVEKGVAAAADADALLARMLANGDMSADLKEMRLQLYDADGTRLERNAMGFHYNGVAHGAGNPLQLLKADGTSSTFEVNTAGYATLVLGAPSVGAPAPAPAQASYYVNGAPPAPGAPFADPCGAPKGFGLNEMNDPFRADVYRFFPDKDLSGFRRYDASAVQLDQLIVNRAGWHDPQARIDVLTATAFDFKKQGDKPNIRRDVEPFFFRARSGDCIEFRHTNELPRNLERDDFQVKTPTDTVGQHIHLVKFDVTASDGSGNGWNYEDGTFAPDEIYHRICESRGEVGGSITDAAKKRCGKHHDDIWMLSSKDNRDLFQTTVQRWFADPILSASSLQADGKILDRTMRTVFSHDHFGPSSIQQHGFYTALIIEPHTANVCPVGVTDKSQCDLATDDSSFPPLLDKTRHDADDKLVGARKLIIDARADKEGLSADSREYALAVADFALLYDPHSGSGKDQYKKENPAKGLICLAKEAEELRRNPRATKEQMASVCNGGGLSPIVAANYGADELAAVAGKLHTDAVAQREKEGRPVAAPTRPESISVDHHDPYLVNYMNEPVPLRVGTDKVSSKVAEATSGSPGNGKNKGVIKISDRSGGEKNGHAKGDGLFPVSCRESNWKPGKEMSVAFQRKGDMGDLANVFRSVMFEGLDAGKMHGDPCTPIIEGYDLERIQIRLIQGAQEVQHAFTVEGFPFPRHYDQRFPSYADFTAMSPAAEQDPTFWRACHRAKVALGGVIDPRDGQRYREAAALCDNIEGRESAQEIGISEHFEFTAPFRREGALQGPLSQGGAAGAERKDLLARPAIARRLTASDYLYHFGSLDALWDGAWGLLRVHEMPTKDKAVFDIGDCLLRASDKPDEFTSCVRSRKRDKVTEHVGEDVADKKEELDNKVLEKRLTPLHKARILIGEVKDDNASTATSEEASLAREPSVESDAQSTASRRPMPRFGVACFPGAPHVRATAVAIESTEVDSKGVLYHPQAPELRDPNGRLLVLVDTHAGDDRWPAVEMREIDIDARALIDAASAKARETQEQTGMSPMVLRINAGDCLDLTIVNGLTSGQDEPGDAMMPKIVPLNVDAHNGWDNKTGKFLPGDRKTDIRPSQRIAFSVPLTATTSLQATPWPVGISPMNAIGPLEALRQFFYAGQLNGHFHDALGKKLAEPGFCAAPELEAARLVAYDPRVHFKNPGDRPFIVDVYGRWHTVEGLGDGPREQKWSALAQCIMKTAGEANEGKDIGDDTPDKDEEKQRSPFFWPYAFGVLPIKAVGDTFNHTPHGLFGAVVVEPQGAQYEGRVETVADPNAPQVTIDANKMVASARIKLTKSFEDGGRMIDLPKKPIREHVLFWQDGLNLHATTNGQSTPVADCHVCDDTYDFGKKGVSYRATPFYARLDLRGDNPYSTNATPADQKKEPLNGAADYNAVDLGEHILHPKGEGAQRTPLVLDAEEGEEAMFRVVHPGGRARQRAFVMTGNGFDDLFPGFGFPNAALLAPGKTVTAATRRPLGEGCHLWRDGPALMVGNGVWGLLDVRRENGPATCTPGQ